MPYLPPLTESTSATTNREQAPAPRPDPLDEYGRESFPASDAPSTWWGGTGDTGRQ